MSILFKSLGFLFTLLFALGAIVQYNDPDSLLWIIIYGIAALISLLFALGKISFIVSSVAGFIAFIGFSLSYPEKFEGFEIGAGNIKNIEEGREAFGLLIIAAVVWMYAIRGWYIQKKLKI